MSLLFGGSRDELRRGWLQAWQQARAGAVLTPLETQLAAIVGEHPEYHLWLEQGDAAVQADFGPESGRTNPFLHLSMHMALREQVGTDRPTGIRRIHSGLSRQHGAHDAEHRMMEALGRALWEAQRAGTAPDERRYLEDLERLISTRRWGYFFFGT